MPPLFLNDITVDERGVVYVSDSGDLQGRRRASPHQGLRGNRSQKGEKVMSPSSLTVKRNPASKNPQRPGHGRQKSPPHARFRLRRLLRIRSQATRKTEKIADGFDGGDGLAWDKFGRLFIRSWKTGKVWVIPRPGVSADSHGGGIPVGGRHLPRSDRQIHSRSRHEGRHADQAADNHPRLGSGRHAAADQDRGRVPRSAMDRLEGRDRRRQDFPASAAGPDSCRRRLQPHLRRHPARDHPLLPQRSEGRQDQDFPRHPKASLLQRQAKTSRACSAWRSIRSTRRTASSSSSTR